jgi:hypothetical protein
MSKKEKSTNNDQNMPKNFQGKAKKFTSEYQPTPQAKSLGHLKKKTLEELKNEIVDKSFKIAVEKLDNEELSVQEFLSIFSKAVEMSGFKNSKVDSTIKTYSLFEESVESKANEINKRATKANKK